MDAQEGFSPGLFESESSLSTNDLEVGQFAYLKTSGQFCQVRWISRDIVIVKQI